MSLPHLYYPTSPDAIHSSASLATGAVPKGLSASSAGLLFLLTSKDLQVISSTTKLTSLALSYDPSCVAVNTSGTVVAVGGQDSQVRLYALEKDVLTLSGTLELRNPITSLAFSPDSTVRPTLNLSSPQLTNPQNPEIGSRRLNWQSPPLPPHVSRTHLLSIRTSIRTRECPEVERRGK